MDAKDGASIKREERKKIYILLRACIFDGRAGRVSIIH